jgi:SAM-dependent methyltransferase
MSEMTVQHRRAYPLGATTIEQHRLVSQAARYEPHASWLLDRIGIRPGWRALDIGCGPIGILDLLSERVGAFGQVVGLEREPRFAAMAREEVAARALANTEIIEADALDHRLEEGSFDLVHERLVMINVTAREELVARMMALLRPGGTVILEDVDNVSWLCEPCHPSWVALRDAFFATYAANGGDVFIGRRLPHYLKAAGAQNIEVKVHVDAPAAGDYRRKHLLSIVDSIADKVVDMKIFTAAELQRHREALEAHLEDPATLVIDKLLVQAWGQKRTSDQQVR